MRNVAYPLLDEVIRKLLENRRIHALLLVEYHRSGSGNRACICEESPGFKGQDAS